MEDYKRISQNLQAIILQMEYAKTLKRDVGRYVMRTLIKQ